jgi:phosphohistidine phosphatase
MKTLRKGTGLRLYILRHAVAYSREDWDRPDSERPLSDQGLSTAADVAHMIDALDLGLGVILSSPFERALRTAHIVREHLPDPPPLVEQSGLEPSSFSVDTLRTMLAPYREVSAVMLVGHEPSITEVLESLLGGGRYALKKGGLVRVDLDPLEPSTAILKWFAPPRLLQVHG